MVQFFSGVSDSNSSGLNNGRAFLHLKDRPSAPGLTARHTIAWLPVTGHAAVLGSVVRFVRPLFEHHMTIDEVMHELQPKLDGVPGMRVFLQNPPAIRIGGQFTKSLYQFTLSSPAYRPAL